MNDILLLLLTDLAIALGAGYIGWQAHAWWDARLDARAFDDWYDRNATTWSEAQFWFNPVSEGMEDTACFCDECIDAPPPNSSE